MKPYNFKIPKGTRMRPVFLSKPPQHEEKAYRAFYVMTATPGKAGTSEGMLWSNEDWYIRKTDIVSKYDIKIPGWIAEKMILQKCRNDYAVVLLRTSAGSIAYVECNGTRVNAFIVAKCVLERV